MNNFYLQAITMLSVMTILCFF